MIETSTPAVYPPVMRLPALGTVGKQTPMETDNEDLPALRSHAAGSALLQHLRQRAAGTLPGAVADQQALYLHALRKDEMWLANQQASILQALVSTALPDAADAGDPDAARIVAQVRDLASGLLGDTLQEDAAIGESNREFFERIAALLGQLDTEWVKKFGDALSEYVAIFARINKAMLLLSADGALGKPDKDGNVEVDFDALVQALAEIENALASKGLGPVFKTEDEAKAFLQELGGLNGLTVLTLKTWHLGPPPWVETTYQVGVNPALVTSLREVFEGKTKLSATELSTLMSSKESALEAFNQLNRTFPEKYQQLLRLWDTLQKVLSSSIETMNEGNMAAIRNIGG